MNFKDPLRGVRESNQTLHGVSKPIYILINKNVFDVLLFGGIIISAAEFIQTFYR